MLREATIEPRQEPRQEILRAAARLFQQQGYDATSMNDVAAALKLSKGGLYHHFQSKDEILFHIMSHAMDITEERVINVVRRIDVRRQAADGAEERLRTLIRLHIEVVLSPEDREITVMLHENHPLPPALRRKINAPQEGLPALRREPDRRCAAQAGSSPPSVTPRAAAFALVGMINWIYQWYKPDGPLTGERSGRSNTRTFFFTARWDSCRSSAQVPVSSPVLNQARLVSRVFVATGTANWLLLCLTSSTSTISSRQRDEAANSTSNFSVSRP